MLKLEEEHKDKRDGKPLTDEIAVVVPATDVRVSLTGLASLANPARGSPTRTMAPHTRRSWPTSKLTSRQRTRTGFGPGIRLGRHELPLRRPSRARVVVDIAAKLLEYGCYEVSLGDTTGEGNPQAWRKLWDLLEKRGLPIEKMNVGPHPLR